MTKRERFPALKKKDLREERLLLAFFLPRPPPSGPQFLISKAAYHKHPTPYDLLGGRSPFESNKVSSRGFIATFILKESEEPTFSQ
ncbi:hypothetical protein L1887_46003 [Cichorium endivia]|nr:hypothetical protein L1887_46003 [Cichorium endivia]